LAGGIAHDMNNILQAATGGAALIERRPDNVAQVRRFAKLILEAGIRGTSITQRLLVFARKSDLRAEVINVRELLAGIQEILSHTLSSNISVQVADIPESLKLFADKGQLETVLVNIAANSRDAMPSGGRIGFSATSHKVESSGQKGIELAPGCYVVITVIDNGCGMDRATLARVTEPFFTTKGVGHGTGLGLATARGFAEQSGGLLHIESTPNIGTTVSLWLPEAKAKEATEIGESNRPDLQGIGRRVLLVDDDMLVRETLVPQLEHCGYTVTAAASAEEALSLLRSGGQLDCLVTDLSMPGMDGVSLIKVAHHDHPKLPAILLTGYVQDTAALAVGGAISGTFSLLRKPVLVDALTDRIASLIAVVPSED